MSEVHLLDLFSTVTTHLCRPTIEMVITPRQRWCALWSTICGLASESCSSGESASRNLCAFATQFLTFDVVSTVTTHLCRPTIEMVITPRQRWCALWSTICGLASESCSSGESACRNLCAFATQFLTCDAVSTYTTHLCRPTIEVLTPPHQRWCALWSTI